MVGFEGYEQTWGIKEHHEEFFRQGGPRRVIKNVYDNFNGPLLGRFHTYYDGGVYWLLRDHVRLPIWPIYGGRRRGSFFLNPADKQKLSSAMY